MSLTTSTTALTSPLRLLQWSAQYSHLNHQLFSPVHPSPRTQTALLLQPTPPPLPTHPTPSQTFPTPPLTSLHLPSQPFPPPPLSPPPTSKPNIPFQANDTAIVGCIRDGQEVEYRNLVDDFMQWCRINHLQLNTSKTKEMVVDYRRSKPPLQPVYRRGQCGGGHHIQIPGNTLGQ